MGRGGPDGGLPPPPQGTGSAFGNTVLGGNRLDVLQAGVTGSPCPRPQGWGGSAGLAGPHPISYKPAPRPRPVSGCGDRRGPGSGRGGRWAWAAWSRLGSPSQGRGLRAQQGSTGGSLPLPLPPPHSLALKQILKIFLNKNELKQRVAYTHGTRPTRRRGGSSKIGFRPFITASLSFYTFVRLQNPGAGGSPKHVRPTPAFRRVRGAPCTRLSDHRVPQHTGQGSGTVGAFRRVSP